MQTSDVSILNLDPKLRELRAEALNSDEAKKELDIGEALYCADRYGRHASTETLRVIMKVEERAASIKEARNWKRRNSVNKTEALVIEDVQRFNPEVRHQSTATDMGLHSIAALEDRALKADRLKNEVKSLRRQLNQVEQQTQLQEDRGDSDRVGFDASKWLGMVNTEEGQKYVEAQVRYEYS